MHYQKTGCVGYEGELHTYYKYWLTFFGMALLLIGLVSLKSGPKCILIIIVDRDRIIDRIIAS